jgi:hypothetical protein
MNRLVRALLLLILSLKKRRKGTVMSRREWLWLGLLIVLLGAIGLGCTRKPRPVEPDGPVWFEDVTEQVGLDFVHDAGTAGNYFMFEQVGSGTALFDFDGDGLLDIYLLNNGGPKGKPNQLFKQMADGTFQNVSIGSGLDFAGHCMGVAVGDVNNDGLPDVLVTEYRGARLFLNQGKGTFREVTREAGLDNPLWGVSAAFVDYDRDGWLDLVIANYLDYDPAVRCKAANGRSEFCHPNVFPGTVTKLFRNLGRLAGGAKVRFEDRTLASGLGQLSGPALGVACADFNGDGWPDILIANDGKPNYLWINQKDGTFREQAVIFGLAYNVLGKAQGNMGIALGDVDGDGLFDVFVTHLTEETNTLWLQGPRGIFRDRTGEARLMNPRWRGTGFGVVLADFDNDGALDLAIANGRVSEGKMHNEAELGAFWSRYAEHNQLFRNDGQGKFRDLSEANEAFCGTAGVSRGLVVGDVNGDGALDLLVTKVAGKARLFRNVAAARGHWLSVRAVLGAEAGRRDAYGAEVTVTAGRQRWVRQINPGQSYLCSHAPVAHFGLGTAERVHAIEVLWPNGRRETFPGGPADKAIVLHEGKGARASK